MTAIIIIIKYNNNCIYNYYNINLRTVTASVALIKIFCLITVIDERLKT